MSDRMFSCWKKIRIRFVTKRDCGVFIASLLPVSYVVYMNGFYGKTFCGTLRLNYIGDDRH